QQAAMCPELVVDRLDRDHGVRRDRGDRQGRARLRNQLARSDQDACSCRGTSRASAFLPSGPTIGFRHASRMLTGRTSFCYKNVVLPTRSMRREAFVERIDKVAGIAGVVLGGMLIVSFVLDFAV